MIVARFHFIYFFHRDRFFRRRVKKAGFEPLALQVVVPRDFYRLRLEKAIRFRPDVNGYQIFATTPRVDGGLVSRTIFGGGSYPEASPGMINLNRPRFGHRFAHGQGLHAPGHCGRHQEYKGPPPNQSHHSD